jgi:hypothetical protein
MYLQRFLVLLFLLIAIDVLGAGDNVPEGARSAALGGASVALADFWSLQNNQAGLAWQQHLTAGAYYENRFLVKELSLKSAGAVLPVSYGVFGLKISHFGYEQFNESKVGLAYARKLSENFAVGVQLDYLHTAIGGDYGAHGAITFEVGLLAHIDDHLSLGAHVYNPIRAPIADYADERIPAAFRLGAAYAFDNNLTLTAEAEKQSDFDVNLKMGIEYRLIPQLCVRGGIATNPALYSFGFGVLLGNLQIDISSSIHQVLGYSPQVGLIYHFK